MIDRKRLEKRLKMIPELTKIRRKLAAQNIAEKSGQIIQEQETLKNPVVQTQKEIVSKLEEQRKDLLDREAMNEQMRQIGIAKPPPPINKARLDEIERMIDLGIPVNPLAPPAPRIAADPNNPNPVILPAGNRLVIKGMDPNAPSVEQQTQQMVEEKQKVELFRSQFGYAFSRVGVKDNKTNYEVKFEDRTKQFYIGLRRHILQASIKNNVRIIQLLDLVFSKLPNPPDEPEIKTLNGTTIPTIIMEHDYSDRFVELLASGSSKFQSDTTTKNTLEAKDNDKDKIKNDLFHYLFFIGLSGGVDPNFIKKDFVLFEGKEAVKAKGRRKAIPAVPPVKIDGIDLKKFVYLARYYYTNYNQQNLFTDAQNEYITLGYDKLHGSIQLGGFLGSIPLIGPLLKSLVGSGQAGGSFLSGIPLIGPLFGMLGLGVNPKSVAGRGLKAIDGGNHYILGEIAIDKQALLIGHLVVRRGNEIIFQSKKVDPDLIELITKRFNPKKAYSAVAIDMWRKLHKLSGLPIVGSHSKKQNLIGSGLKVQFVDNPNQLLERLNILVGSWNAGNKNQEIYNEAIQIIDYLLNKGVINKTAHKKIFNQLK